MEFDYFCGMKPQEVILIGAGGHALSLAEFAGDNIIGYLSKEKNDLMPGKWLGTDDEMNRWIQEGKPFHVAYVYSGLPRMNVRKKIIERYEKEGAKFESLISPSAIVTPRSVIEEGSALMTGCIVNRAHIGRNVIVNSGAIVEHDCRIGDNSFIGPGAVIGGFTTVGENCFIGLGARIGNGLKIGPDITVAMGAVVSKDLTEPGIYHGTPLRLFKCKN